jgi:peptide/nickel transport system ATP-binding protein
MIAMALALRPAVLIADEPTTALDVTVQAEILDLLRGLQRDLGTAIILITHDMGVVAEMADRVVVMKSGEVVETGAVADLFAAPKHLYTQALLAAVPRMGKGEGAQVLTTEPVLKVRDLAVRYDITGGLLSRVTHHVNAVAGINFDIREGEIFSIVGESGCGKSTVARALTGLAPFSGTIEINGRTLDRRGPDKAARRDIQMIFQDPMASLDPRMTVGDLVAEPLVIHGIGSRAEQRATVSILFEKVGLTQDQIDRYPHEFSGGQRQRICIARALALRPRLIIADESVAALDVSVQAKVLDLMKDLKAQFGIAFLFISHDMAVVENISDRIAVMYLGQIVECGTRAQIFGSPRHAYTRRLMDAVPIPEPGRTRPQRTGRVQELRSPIVPVGQKPQHLVLNDIGDGHLVAVEA